MKNSYDPFPQTPEGFHLRVENTLMRMEEEEMKYVRKYSLKALAVAAAIILTLAVTAVAAVQGGLLKEVLKQEGADELAVQVQEVHAGTEKDGFSLTVDEVLWVYDEMYISYTVTVPDDGHTYIYGVNVPKLNGEEIFHTSGGYINDNGDADSMAYVIGGEFGNTDTQILSHLYLDPDGRASAGNELNIKAWFFQTDKELVGLANGAKISIRQKERVVEGKQGHKLQFFSEIPENDIAYYWVKEWEGSTRGYMMMNSWPDVNAVIERQVAEAQDVDDSFFDAEPLNYSLVDNYWHTVQEAERVDVERLASEGVIELLSALEADIQLDMAEAQGAVYTSVEQDTFEGDGYTLRISDFLLTNLGARVAVEVSFDKRVVGWSAADGPMNPMYGLLRMDGAFIGKHKGSASSSTEYFKDGSSICRSEWNYSDVISLEGLDQVQLAVMVDGELTPMDPPVILTPVAKE